MGETLTHPAILAANLLDHQSVVRRQKAEIARLTTENARLREALTQAKLDALNGRPLPPDWLDAVGSGPALDERVDVRGQGG